MGRCYRRDEIDATHYPMFHQVDAIAIDRGISFTDLKWTLFEMLRGAARVRTSSLRFRPSYFPFTTPSAEVDVFYRGRWMELLGSGMMHPDVLRHANLDPTNGKASPSAWALSASAWRGTTSTTSGCCMRTMRAF